MNQLAETASTKERIVTTALALFKARGLAGVSTRDVSQACGLSRSHLYHYFADWGALRNSVFLQLATTEIDEISSALKVLGPTQALSVFVQELLPVNRDSSWMLWLDAWDEALRDDSFAEIYIAAMQQWEAVLASIVRRGVKSQEFKCEKPDRAAKQLFSMVNGYAADLLLAPSKKLHKAAVQDVMDIAQLLLRPKL